MCAMAQTQQSVKEAPNFSELRKAEVRRIPLPRTPLNKGRAEDGRPDGACILRSVDDEASLCFIGH